MASSSLKDYTSLDHCVSGPGITPDLLTSTDSIYPGCHCNETCSSDSDIPCSCSIAYTTDRCLLDAYLTESSPPIFECNANCSCNVSCFNRTSQQYSYHPGSICFIPAAKAWVCARWISFLMGLTWVNMLVNFCLHLKQWALGPASTSRLLLHCAIQRTLEQWKHTSNQYWCYTERKSVEVH